MATRVELVEYDPRWPIEFTRAALELRELLQLPSSAIEHVGSTAVPGLAAKPLIDIDVTVFDVASIPKLATVLENAGYQPRGTRHDDGVFAFLMSGHAGRRVYLCPPGSQTHLDRMSYRNALRANPHLSSAYCLLKQELAKLYPEDGDRYTAAKGDFIRSVISAPIHAENALVPELAVSNWRASRRFYVDLIGFSVLYERPEEGFSFLTLGAAQLMIDQIGLGRTFDGDAPLVPPLGRGLNLQLRVPSVSTVLERLRQAGHPLALPLEEKWYRRNDHEVGNRQFLVADPDGYLLRPFEDLGARPSTSAT
jgi:GrpB-like predicted nucleotidyltransferase (UPF0157 family)/catechol 2,3-dioxygenase-like lactoylglutathione lyase family enzyme